MDDAIKHANRRKSISKATYCMIAQGEKKMEWKEILLAREERYKNMKQKLDIFSFLLLFLLLLLLLLVLYIRMLWAS